MEIAGALLAARADAQPEVAWAAARDRAPAAGGWNFSEVSREPAAANSLRNHGTGRMTAV